MEIGRAWTLLSNMGQEELKYLGEQCTMKSGHCQIQDTGLLRAEFTLWLSKVRTQIVCNPEKCPLSGMP